MRLSVAATGSQANCYVLHGSRHALLLDAGVPMARLLPYVQDCFNGIQGCLVTHNHGDHSKGCYEIAKRGIPTYCSDGCRDILNGYAAHAPYMTAVKAVEARAVYHLGDFAVMPFEVEHDAIGPFGYLIKHVPTNETLIYATDTYYLRYRFPGVNYWIVECNYIDEALDTSTPKSLRDRLMRSHMSLDRLKDALAANDLTETRKIVLVHLSNARSDEARMIREIHDLTGVDTVAADAGMIIDLDLIPF